MYDFLVIGGGVIGTAVARRLAEAHPHAKIALIEKEAMLAAHTSGRNSGVLHVGYNQKPGTLKARLCVEGNRRIRAYCAERKVPLDPNGILVVARSEQERSILEELLRRGRENGAPDLRILDRDEMREREPNVDGLAALLAPSGAAVDASGFVQALARDAAGRGVRLFLGTRVAFIERTGRGFLVRTNDETFEARKLVNCAGLHADRVAHQLGAGLEYSIVPFRGEFYYLDGARSGLIHSMIYGVPDIRYPFLGVHWTKMFDGRIKVGPNAVLAFGRESYHPLAINLRDCWRMAIDARFWRMFATPEFRSLALANLRTSLSKRAFLSRALALVKGVSPADFRRGTAGIRAQLVDRRGQLVDDLVVVEQEGALHVLNAVSPGFTCSLPFADHLVERFF